MEKKGIEITPIAHIETDFGTKFGIPRQAGLVQELKGRVIFEPAFRSAEAVRGIENYSHLWLIWQFSENLREDWSPTVRPPRLGGNTRVGVFATRSPFRPNALGLSCVRLEAVETDRQLGPVLVVSGADLMNGTPIFDVKPYLPYADCIPEASEGFADILSYTNVANMSNTSRGSFAYTLIDIDDGLEPETVEKLKSVQDVVRVRIVR